MSGTTPSTDRPAFVWLKAVVVVLVSLAVGGLTSPAQGWLPDPLRPFANSASGWTLLTALILWAVRLHAVPSAILGFASFAALVLGYQVVSDLRGSPDTELFFLAVSVVVGPLVGLAAYWIRGRDVRAALGCGLLAGIGIGDGTSGLIRVAATTGWLYWTLIAMIGAALVALQVPRLHSARARAIAILAALAVAGVYVAVFAVL